mmetsp:Transcript_1921/g.4562  ORF Transcript_1921/g.4562 Transcript_1921/m.4562 type:complete len:202 (+) Transcript_1921:793-1398(+)
MTCGTTKRRLPENRMSEYIARYRGSKMLSTSSEPGTYATPPSGKHGIVDAPSDASSSPANSKSNAGKYWTVSNSLEPDSSSKSGAARRGVWCLLPGLGIAPDDFRPSAKAGADQGAVSGWPTMGREAQCENNAAVPLLAVHRPGSTSNPKSTARRSGVRQVRMLRGPTPRPRLPRPQPTGGVVAIPTFGTIPGRAAAEKSA